VVRINGLGGMKMKKEPKMVLKCNFCGKVFKRANPNKFYECPCPKCHETDVEVIGMERRDN
jgi:phage FluMu protein Com